MKLLLVEDEEDLSCMVAKGLRKSGYAVDVACDGEEALYYYELGGYDLIILDLNLPKLDGLEVLKCIRQTDSYIKIIILSARSRIDERVQGLDIGANDYLIKPFDFMELEARIRTLIRIEFKQQPSILQLGNLRLDANAKVVNLNDIPLNLTKKEYAILEYLFHHKGSVVSSEELFEHIWDSNADPFSNAVKYHVHCMKKKLKSVDERYEYIINIRGQGYMLAEGCK